MRKALIVGINYYGGKNDLNGCVNDAYNIKTVLERNADGTLNFDVNLMTAVDEDTTITKSMLKDNIENLFDGDSEIALFYYSGHGYIESTGGYLVTSECQRGDEGLDLNHLMTIANNSTSSYPSITPDDIAKTQIKLPSIATQKKIARLLSLLDRKISENDKINDNLVA